MLSTESNVGRSATPFSCTAARYTSWARITCNSDYNNASQWSKGEYSGANNTQDDITVITSQLDLIDDNNGDAMGDAMAPVIDSP